MYKIETRGHCQEENIESRRQKISEKKSVKAKIRRWQIRGAEGGSNNHNQRTNGPVNAHLISWPTLVKHKHIKPEKYMVKK